MRIRGVKHLPLVVLTGLLALTLFTEEARADDLPGGGWAAGGIGLGRVGSHGAQTGRVEVSGWFGRQVLSLRYTQTEEEDIVPVIVLFPGDVSLPRNEDRELALLYGMRVRSRGFLASASGGPAAVWTVQRGSTLLQTDSCGFFGGCQQHYDSTGRFAVGAALETGAYLSTDHLSFGPTLIADVNAVQSYWTILFLDFHIGWMGSASPRTRRQPLESPP
jgi:hypothetical protein